MTFKSGLSLWSLCNKCVTSCFFGKFFGHELREIYCSGGLKPATGDWAILLIADDAVPAAERLKNVAPGVSPGSPCRRVAEPRKGRKIWVFRPSGAEFNANTNPGLAPGATFLIRSAAGDSQLISSAHLFAGQRPTADI